MTKHRYCPAARRVAFYGRTNRTGPDAERDLARQYQLSRAIAGRFGQLTSHFYDIGRESRYDQAWTSGVATAGGPPSREGGCAEMTAELTNPNPAIDMILLADYDRLPRQPGRRRPLLAATERARCPVLSASDPSALDRYAGADEWIVALVLRGTDEMIQAKAGLAVADDCAAALRRSRAPEFHDRQLLRSDRASTWPRPAACATPAPPDVPNLTTQRSWR
jgi:hypothetical protein